MFKYVLPLVLLATPAFAECNWSDNFAAQKKIESFFNHSLFLVDSLTGKEKGDEHWRIRIQLIPWAKKIKDPCVRPEAIGYLESELSTLEDDGHTETLNEAITKGEKKADTMKWPRLP